jgi:hypothetical protein
MTDFKKLAFVGVVSLGLATVGSVGCSSSNNTTGTGGSTGMGGTSSHTGGSTGTGGSASGTGGAAGATLGCAASDAPPSAEIADFSGGDASIQIIHGDNDPFTYGDTPAPTFSITGGMLTVMDTVQIDAKNHYQGVGIYFNGNAAGTDCLDGHAYTGVQFDISGSLMGANCTMQFSINDSEHGDSSVLKADGTPNDPKAAGPKGSYSPQLAITSAQLTTASQTIKVPFTGTSGGSPSAPVDPTKLTGVQWQMTVPLAADGGATECVWNINLANVKFY